MTAFSDLAQEWAADDARRGFCAELAARRVPVLHRPGPDGQPAYRTVLDREMPVVETVETAGFDQLRRQWAAEAPEDERGRRAAMVDDLVEALHGLDLEQVSADSSRPVQLSVQIPVSHAVPAALPVSSPPAETSLMSAPVPGDGPSALPPALPALTGRNIVRTPWQARQRQRLAELYDRRMS